MCIRDSPYPLPPSTHHDATVPSLAPTKSQHILSEMPADGFDLPPGVTSDQFSQWLAVDADVQTAAEVTDEELCAGQQAAGDVDTDGEMSSKAIGEADDNRQQPSQVTLSNALLCLDTDGTNVPLWYLRNVCLLHRWSSYVRVTLASIRLHLVTSLCTAADLHMCKDKRELCSCIIIHSTIVRQ